ncbi:MAG TPA: molybdate ABC transporter substrate-binding protein [Anaerolineaceae bacterium]|nr:molybdate ABC transporter substrate-binding protein [Anaerolineaceae bacterium]
MLKPRAFALVVIVALLVSACAPRSLSTQPSPTTQVKPAGTLNVFAAASLTASFNEIGKAFESKNPGVKITYNFAGSQQLAQQINSGAPADVFASANQAQMDAVMKNDRIASSASKVFVNNRLVVVYPKANPGKIQSLQDLARPGLKLVMADKAVPVGQYALNFLDNAAKDTNFSASYKESVLHNVASYEQDVKSVLTKVMLGEADAGIVYTTDATSDREGKTTQLAIPDNLNVIAAYPIAVLKDSSNPKLAQDFVDYILSDEGQAVLSKYGFIPVSQ